jgi:hypothetical protein
MGGTVTSELGLLSNLEELCLANNVLSHTFPTELGLLTKIDDFHFGDNMLSGPIEWGRLTELQIRILS